MIANLAGMIAPGGFGAACGKSFAGKCDLNYGVGHMRDGSGAVGIRGPKGGLGDSVAYGMVSPMNAFIRTKPAPAPALSQSIGRIPDGTDSGDNSHDFKLTKKVTPDQPNQ